MTTEISYPLAFVAGVFSFVSPCVLPIFPSYLSFITGLTFETLTDNHDGVAARLGKRHVLVTTLTNSLVFVAGFSSIFMALGASSSLVGSFFLEHQKWIRILGGVVVILFGLFIAGFLKMDFLQREKKLHISNKPANLLGTYFVGMAFAAGWTPCIGPILGTILLYSANVNATDSTASATYGLKLLAVYSIGLGIPFVASALALNTFLSFSRKLLRHMPTIVRVSGVVLILFGMLLLTDNFKLLSTIVPDLGIKW
ncbi:MAG: cytochrome C biogenesis protein CcdA [Nitrospirae bacterium]|uniref:cytochrome c biogenesis CcdA family protein n=1 Tax=Candidatus Magnetobacterium casense TaxID=1455061 RepID=UPI00058AFA72|nr:cytochrome c biogenesis protein CcdA [Candidatus Magnetobacterium casensis]MBF0338254.1 cytochrome C biogenesis protein CcdA [Nitrospirota bacterium]